MEEYHAEDTLTIFHLSDIDDIKLAFQIVGDTACQSFFGAFLCFFEFPPCNVSTSELLPICLDRCPEMQEAHRYCFQGVNSTIVDPKKYPTLRNIIDNFNCSVPETYYFSNDSVLISTTSCSKLM